MHPNQIPLKNLTLFFQWYFPKTEVRQQKNVIFVIYYVNSFLHTLDFIATFSHLTDPNLLPEGLGWKSLILLVTLKLKTKHYFISFCYKNVFLAHHLVVMKKSWWQTFFVVTNRIKINEKLTFLMCSLHEEWWIIDLHTKVGSYF